jgi:ADP-heptose:LPS heptosyltransferase
MDGVIELPFFLDDAKFLEFCKDKNYEPCRFLMELDYLKDIQFYPMDLWFKDYAQSTIDTHGCVGFQIASSSHYDRPAILYINNYLKLVVDAGLKPVFFGIKKDEELFLKHYPNIYDKYSSDDHAWRFGKDTLPQIISNIRNLYGHIVFASGTSPIAVFQGVPVLELWGSDQFQFFSPFTHYMCGSPIHHITQAYDAFPNKNLIKAVFPKLKDYCRRLYGTT